MASVSRSSRPPHRSARTHENVLAALSDVVEISSDDNRRGQDHHPYPGGAYSPPEQSHSIAYSGAVPMTTAEPPLSSMPSSGNLASYDDPLGSGQPPPVPTKSRHGNTSSYESDQPKLPASKSSMAGKFANAFKRQTAEEKEAKRREKAQKNGQSARMTALESSRMDVIDKLDASGIHGSSLFHHDSPYDACTPHANSHQRAPVKAFDPDTDPMTGLSIKDRGAGAGGASRPAAPQRIVSESDSKARARSVKRNDSGPIVNSLSFQDQGSFATRLPTTRDNYHSADSPAIRDNASVTTASDVDPTDRSYSRGPTTAKPNSAMAAMWGVQDDEPWQDFAAPRSSPRSKPARTTSKANGSAGGRSSSPGYLGAYDSRPSGDGRSSTTSSVLDMEAVMTGKTAEEKRRAAEGYVPPSQEIAGVSPFPEPDYDRSDEAGSAPKRNKSLLRRIKSARQNPNVPPPADDSVEMSGRTASRRYGPNAHRHANSGPSDTSRATGGGGRDWSGLTSGNLGGESPGNGGSSSLGRNGTRRATREEKARYFDAGEGGNGVGATGGAANDGPRPAGSRYAAAMGGLGDDDYGGGGGGAASGSDVGYFFSSSQPQAGSAPERNPARSPSGAEGGSGGGLGRSGSLFGRFGRKGKSGERAHAY